MIHPLVPTPLKFGTKCAHGILTGVLKQKNIKVWACDSTGYMIYPLKKQLHTHWKRRKHNLEDFLKIYHTAKN